MSKYPGRIVTDLAPAGYSVFFDGSGDFLTLPTSNSTLWLGSADYSVEAWAYLTTKNAYNNIFSYGTTGSVFRLFVETSQITVWTGATPFITYAYSAPVNTWLNIVVTRASGRVRLFVNGVLVGTALESTNYNTGTLNIGAEAGSLPFTGYIASARIVKGSVPVEYQTSSTTTGTTIFSPPTQLFNITNTSLLTCNSPALVDQSTNNFAITANGDAAVSTFTPFTAYVPYNPALGASTPGVWTVDEAMQAAATRQWNMYDPYFNLTTLLLHGNGANTAQNNQFLDSSSNNFSITRNGNTTQGSYSPFSQTGWSNFFLTSDNYFGVSGNSAFSFNADFTVECFVFQTARSDNGVVTEISSYLDGVMIRLGTIGGIYDTVYVNGTNVASISTHVALNTWVHIAVVRSGTAVTVYVNGTSRGTATISGTVNTTSGAIRIAAPLHTTPGTQPFQGYISNFRIVKGTAVYTSGFTPPTAPLTAITNTSFLTCQSNRFVDNSTNNFTITTVGTPSVQAFSPFLPTAAYTPQTIGGSGYFDGTGDNLAVPTSSENFVGSGSFYFEAWVYLTNPSVAQMIIADPANTGGLFVGLNIDGGGRFAIGRTAVAVDNFVNLTWLGNSWYHLAVNRNGTSLQFFVNGTQVGSTGTNSVNYPSRGYRVGAEQAAGSAALTGYISGLRLVRSSVNTSNFAIPTAPPNPTGSALCLQFSNAGIVDSTADNVLETVGGVQISTAQSRFGGSSVFMDGSGDYLQVAPNPLFDLRTSDFTVEFWIYPTTFASATYPMYSQFNRSTTNAFAIEVSTGGVVFVYVTNAGGAAWSIINGGNIGTLTLNTWNHVAFVRNGTAFRGYVNGVQGALSTNSSNTIETFNGFNIGATGLGTSGYFTGYLDEYRITRFARYTGNFTPPTSQLQDQ